MLSDGAWYDRTLGEEKMNWILGYNSNGFAHHRLLDLVDVLADLGYRGLALTLDNHHLDPFGSQLASETNSLKSKLAEHQFELVIESGARFNLDGRTKHYPSLLTRRHRGRRIDFLKRCLAIAAELNASCVSLWSGHNFDHLATEEAFELLVLGLEEVLVEAESLGIDLAFEPEPGMFSETLMDYAALKQRLPSKRFGLALDLGHLMVTQESSLPDAIRKFRGQIMTMAIEDMKRGVHEHLPFGEGDIDFSPVMAAIREIDYRGMVSVELSRASSDAVETARAAERFLAPFLGP